MGQLAKLEWIRAKAIRRIFGLEAMPQSVLAKESTVGATEHAKKRRRVNTSAPSSGSDAPAGSRDRSRQDRPLLRPTAKWKPAPACEPSGDTSVDEDGSELDDEDAPPPTCDESDDRRDPGGWGQWSREESDADSLPSSDVAAPASARDAPGVGRRLHSAASIPPEALRPQRRKARFAW